MQYAIVTVLYAFSFFLESRKQKNNSAKMRVMDEKIFSSTLKEIFNIRHRSKKKISNSRKDDIPGCWSPGGLKMTDIFQKSIE